MQDGKLDLEWRLNFTRSVSLPLLVNSTKKTNASEEKSEIPGGEIRYYILDRADQYKNSRSHKSPLNERNGDFS
jgi:hypothetical protein